MYLSQTSHFGVLTVTRELALVDAIGSHVGPVYGCCLRAPLLYSCASFNAAMSLARFSSMLSAAAALGGSVMSLPGTSANLALVRRACSVDCSAALLRGLVGEAAA